MATTKHFPNGFECWVETHHEVVAYLTLTAEVEKSMACICREEGGTGRLWETGEDLTDEFEAENEGREWDGEFYDEIDDFLQRKEAMFGNSQPGAIETLYRALSEIGKS